MQTAAPIEPEAAVSDYEKERGKPMPNLSHSIVQTKIAGRFDVQGGDRYLVASELTLEFVNTTVLIP